MQRLASKANVPIEVLNPPPVLCVGGKCYASSRCSQKKPSENALSPPAAHIFTTDEAATAYALSAERILGGDSLFLDRNPAVVPVFVSQLFQSLEISIKHAGIHSGLFTEAEARSRQMRSGHGISEIADLAVKRLCGQPYDPLVQALTYFHTEHNAAEIIRLMIHGTQFEKTRESYATRRLGYGQVAAGDFAVVDGLSNWVAAVKQTAQNLPKIVSLISQWKASTTKSGPFAVWLGTGEATDGQRLTGSSPK